MGFCSPDPNETFLPALRGSPHCSFSRGDRFFAAIRGFDPSVADVSHNSRTDVGDSHNLIPSNVDSIAYLTVSSTVDIPEDIESVQYLKVSRTLSIS